MKLSRGLAIPVLCVAVAVAGFVTGRVTVGIPQAARPEEVAPPTAQVIRGVVTQTVDIPLSMTSTWTARSQLQCTEIDLLRHA